MNNSLTGLGKSLSRTSLGPGGERIEVGGGAATIPNGVLYACTLTIVAATANGAYAIDNSASAFDATPAALPAGGGDGVVNVTGCGGDCNGSGQVTIAEVSRASGLFLGDPLCNATTPNQSCPVADMIDNNDAIGIAEVSRTSCLFLSGTCSKTCP